MAEIVNLRRVRKGKARSAKAAEAGNNRNQHGVAKPVRALAEARTAKSAQELDAHRLDSDK